MKPLVAAGVVAVLGAALWLGLVPLPLHGEDDAIRVAVFRYQFEHNASGLRDPAAFYCLSLSLAGEAPRDPSNGVMAAFKDHTPPVKLRSECNTSPSAGVTDKTTGQRGLMFYIRRVSRTGLNRATARGGYYASGLGGSGNTYQLVREGEEWLVTSDVMDWIS